MGSISTAVSRIGVGSTTGVSSSTDTSSAIASCSICASVSLDTASGCTSSCAAAASLSGSGCTSIAVDSASVGTIAASLSPPAALRSSATIARISASIGSTATTSNAGSSFCHSSGVVAQVLVAGLSPARNCTRARLLRPSDPSRMLRATCPLMGTAAADRFKPDFLSLVRNSSAASLCHSRV